MSLSMRPKNRRISLLSFFFRGPRRLKGGGEASRTSDRPLETSEILGVERDLRFRK